MMDPLSFQHVSHLSTGAKVSECMIDANTFNESPEKYNEIEIIKYE